jgi:FlaA1/EpsC-like NDP-sugar epimerase
MIGSGLWGKPVVIRGTGKAGERLLSALQRDRSLGLRPIAVFDITGGRALEGLIYGGTLTDAMGLAREQVADTSIFAMRHARRSRLFRFVELATRNFRNVLVIPDLARATTSAVMARHLARTFGVEIKHNLLDPGRCGQNGRWTWRSQWSGRF